MHLQLWNQVDGLAFLLIDYLGIDLSCTDIAVAEKFGDCVEVGSVCQCQGQGCECVTADVERYLLVYSGGID